MRTFRTLSRPLLRQPGSSLLVVATLALGLGASTALFACLISILRPALDAPEPERLAWVYCGIPGVPDAPLSYPDYADLRREQRDFRPLAAFSTLGASVVYREVATFAWGQLVSGDYFSLFAARPALGRLLTPEDERPGAPAVLVASDTFWRSVLGADPAAVGRPLRINGETFTLVGVAPRGFQGQGLASALYLPLGQADRLTGSPRTSNREIRWLSVMGRLTGGTPPQPARARAQEALARWARGLDAAAPLPEGPRQLRVAAHSGFSDGAGDPQLLPRLRLLAAAAGLFLLLGCASVANLLLARATASQGEISVRAALGASRARLFRAALTDSLLLCLLGGAAGWLLALFLGRRLDGYLLTVPGGLGNWAEGNQVVVVGPRAALFLLFATLACALLCGLAPALRAMRRDLEPLLRSRTAAEGARGLGARKLLLVTQVALSVLLLLGSGLLVRTLRSAGSTDPGFSPDRYQLATLYIPRNLGTDRDTQQLAQGVLAAAGSLPEIEAAGLLHVVPLSGVARQTQVAPDEKREAARDVDVNLISAGALEAVGVPLREGRAIGPQDRADAPPVAVISRSLARRLWGDGPAVGRRLYLPQPLRPLKAADGSPLPPVFEVVGVTEDVRFGAALAPPPAMLYLSLAQQTHARVTLALRTRLSPGRLAPLLRTALRGVHPDLPLVELTSGREVFERSLFQQRMQAEVGSLFALLGLGVALLGLFGLLSFLVSLRVQEIGVRLAVGARRADISRLMLGQGLGLVAAGLAIGLLAALGLNRLLASLLYGVGSTDPLTFFLVPALFTAVAFLACLLPSLRAARLDPLRALRAE